MNELPPYIVPHSQEPIKLLYEDEHLLLVRKPHLLLSVPGRHPLNRDCLLTRLQKTWPEARMVHRLDLDTSGIMVIPLSSECLSHLARQFQRRQVKKRYVAVVYGRVAKDAGDIDLPIAPDWSDRPRQVISHARGKAALTHYRVIARGNDRTRMDLAPETGRSHQLRIHMRELGHPILGCDLYAHPSALALSERMLLHATQLGFHHPASEQWMDFSCAPDF